MVITRIFDQKSIVLQRTGRLGTYASSLGQEATSVGIGSGMHEDDILVPYFRDQGAQFWRGVKFEEILHYWGGNEWGNHFEEPKEDFPLCVPIATQGSHATGVAHAIKLRNEKRAVVCVMGDGATSKGEMYEAFNLAGVWELPIIFVIQNNMWAISVPLHLQTKTQTLAQKGISAGIDCEQVDGNDIIAVHNAVSNAVKKARNTSKPHLIEALTYRLGDHTTADDATKYRKPEEVSQHWKTDPIARMRTFMGKKGIWTKQEEEQLVNACKDKIDAAIKSYEEAPERPVTDMFDYLYETLPECYQKQRKHLIQKSETAKSTGNSGNHG